MENKGSRYPTLIRSGCDNSCPVGTGLVQALARESYMETKDRVPEITSVIHGKVLCRYCRYVGKSRFGFIPPTLGPV